MKFSTPFVASLLAALASSASADLSAPFALFRGRAPADPTIITPLNGSVLVPGELANVTWSTAGFDPPTCGAVVNTALYLARDGAISDDGSPGSLNNPLSSNFSITQGIAYFMVPDVALGDDYSLNLKADSSDPTDVGSLSPEFSIAETA